MQEEVRKAIAYQIGCAQCMSHGCPAAVITDKKTKAAVDFARKVSQTQLPVTKEDVEHLREYFNDKEIAELSAFVSFGTGYARFGAALIVDAALP